MALSKSTSYRLALRDLHDWESYLLAESGLPGPRANLELVQAAADEGNEAQFRRWLTLDASQAGVNTPQVFLVVCGVVGLGRLLASGRMELLPLLRSHAADTRWRVREAVCMAMQRWGDVSMPSLLSEMETWSQGTLWEQRAAAASLCEPRLLADTGQTARVLRILDAITASLRAADERQAEPFRVLRQALGYCWSVAVVAAPDVGKPAFAQWLACPDPDVRWVMRENLKKHRLLRMDAVWVAACQNQL